ncbi:MAG: hypothetical protein AABW91_04285 [Nanoarchaeota archaeon]
MVKEGKLLRKTKKLKVIKKESKHFKKIFLKDEDKPFAKRFPNEPLGKVPKTERNNKDKESEEFSESSESKLEEEVETPEATEDIRFKELDVFLKSLSGFEQDEVARAENLEKGVSEFRLMRREDSDDEKQEISYKTSRNDENNQYNEVTEEAVGYVALDSGPERDIGIVRHDTGFEIGASAWHRSDISKSGESTESMSQKARAGYEIRDKREGIFESQDRKYKLGRK